MSQLALPLKLDDHAVFGSFWPARNEATVAFLEELAATGEGAGCWLFGPPASGKSHLLQAVCARAGESAIYLPLAALFAAGPAILDGAASRRFVCIDDVDQAAAATDWEEALFALWNELCDAGGTLLVTSASSLRESRFRLPDLRSRLSQLTAFRLQALAEPDRVDALKLRARHRGLELPDDTARYLLHRSRRDMASLYALLDRLDAEALRAQRRLTVPFVRDVLRA